MTDTYLIVLQILPHIIAVALLPLRPKEIPKQTEPVQKEGGLLPLAGETGTRKVVGHFQFITDLDVGHDGFAVHAVDFPMAGTRLDGRLGVELNGFVLDERSCTLMVAALQEVVVYVGVEIIYHSLGTPRTDSRLVAAARNGRAITHHGDGGSGHRTACCARIQTRHIHLVHGGDRATVRLYIHTEMFQGREGVYATK